MAAHAAKSAQRGQVKIAPADAAKLQTRADHLAQTLQTLREQLVRKELSEKVDGASDEVPGIQRNADRPASLEDMIGQHDLIQQLRVVIAGAMVRGERIPHCLLVGSSGLGKTTIAQIIAEEVGVELIQTTGMLLKKAPDLIGLLVGTEGLPTCLFVDEIHAASKVCQETLYTVLEDGVVDALGGSGPDTVATTQALPGLIVIGATTAPGKLTQPFRDRFGFVGQLAPYSDDEISQIVARYWKAHNVTFAKSESMALAVRSKNVPRRALHLCQRVMDYIAVQDMPTIAAGTTAEALSIFGVDANGLEANDVAVLRSLVKDFAGRPIGLDALAQRLSMDVSTLSGSIEPWLSQSGYLVRTKTGRVATAKAHELVRSL